MTQPANGKKGFSYIAAAIVIAAILVSATLVLAPTSRSTTTVTFASSTTATQTVTSTSTQTTTLTSVSTSTSTSVSTSYTTLTSVSTTVSTSYALLPAACASAESYTPSGLTVMAGASSPAVICLQLYDFDSTSPVALDTASLLSIEGELPHGPNVGGGNFTVTASQGGLTMGGPSDLNEGTIVAYSITANPGASGTYGLHIDGLRVTSQGGEECGLSGSIIAGTGQPDYLEGIISLCDYLIFSAPTPYSIPGANFTVGGNEVYYKIIDAVNSTQ